MSSPRHTPLVFLATPTELFLCRRGTHPSEDVWFAFSWVEGRLRFSKKAAPPPAAAVTRSLEADAIYGVFTLLRGPYVAVVSRSVRVGTAPNGAAIKQVQEMQWLLVGSGAGAGGGLGKPSPLTLAEEHEERKYLGLLANLGRSRSFYFSLGYDMTHSVQRLHVLVGGGSGGGGGGNLGAAAGVSSAALGAAAASAATAGEGNNSSGVCAPPSTPALAAGLPHQWWLHSDERFFWNRSVLRELVGERGFADSAPDIFAPFISGFVGAEEGGLDLGAANGNPVDALLLVSRRSVTRQGVRFVMRGSDADGNVANFVETEQVLRLRDGAIASFVQLRGSIPLMWEQPATLKYAPRVTISSNVQASIGAFQRHAAATIRRYGRVTAVSLIDHKGDQLRLGNAYEDASRKVVFPTHHISGTLSSPLLLPQDGESSTMMSGGGSSAVGGSGGSSVGSGVNGGGLVEGASSSTLSSAPWLQVWFDFHHECRAMAWGNLHKLLAQVQSSLQEDGYFYAPATTSTTGNASSGVSASARRLPLRLQSGVLRTNCMDNLDRTNVVQSIFFRASALAAVPGAADAARAAGCSVLTSPFPVFEKAFNALCADNADALSLAYSGTGALKTDFTRTGKRTIRGALSDGVNSVTRYVLNNFADGAAQDAWDLWLTRYVPERVRSDRAAGDGKRGGLLSPYKAHEASPTPRSVLLRVAAVWVGTSVALAALVVPRVFASSHNRGAWGMAGATLILTALASYFLSKGAPPAVRKLLISRPSFLPHSGQ